MQVKSFKADANNKVEIKLCNAVPRIERGTATIFNINGNNP